MKKALLITLVVAVLGAAVWGGLWLAGRGQITDRIDLEVARIEATGKSVTWESLDIGGFPSGYEVRARNVAYTNTQTGLLVRVPEVVSTVKAATFQTVEIIPIGDVLIDLPVPEQTRETNLSLPRVFKLVFSGDEVRASAEGITSLERTLTLAASTATLKMDQDDTPMAFELSMAGLNASAQRTGDKLSTSTQAERMALNATSVDENDTKAKLDSVIESLTLTTSAEWAAGETLNDVLFGTTKGKVDIVYSAGRIDATAVSLDATGQGGGTFSYSGSAGTGVIGIQDQVLEVRGETRQNRWSVDPKQAASTFRGALTAEAFQAHYKVPTGPSDSPGNSSFRLAVLDLNADEAVWAALDEKQLLDRSPAELLIDLEATALIKGRLDQQDPAQGAPIELSNISLNTVNVKALGSELQASGDVEVLQPINLPLGEIKVELTNGNALLLALKEADLIDETMRATAAAMLQVYARPVEGEADKVETDLTFGNEGITMNGLQVR